MIGRYNYIGTSFSGLIQKIDQKGKKYSVFFLKYMSKGDRMSHLVGYSELK